MKIIGDYVNIIDITEKEDDPYSDWEIRPFDKFIDELKKEYYTNEEIYRIDLDKEAGILIEYDLFPHEQLRWDKKEKNMKLRMKYTPLIKFKKALIDLGINYDRKYWK